jgi:uncharacterized protein YecT (DUF1311 family)
MRMLAIAALALLAAGPALADEEYDRCIAESDGTNTAWGECGGAWIEREDARLNETWQRLIADAGDRMKADLRAEQRAWIAYKDLSCLFYANGEFGREGQVVSFPACRAEVIAKRTAELETYADLPDE